MDRLLDDIQRYLDAGFVEVVGLADSLEQPEAEGGRADNRCGGDGPRVARGVRVVRVVQQLFVKARKELRQGKLLFRPGHQSLECVLAVVEDRSLEGEDQADAAPARLVVGEHRELRRNAGKASGKFGLINGGVVVHHNSVHLVRRVGDADTKGGVLPLDQIEERYG